jgi:hypothetical protein
MNPVVNPSFEEAGLNPGEALGWTLSSLATVEEWAAFGTSPRRAVEDFGEWDGTEGAIFAFVPAHIVSAFFGPASKPEESFDAGWGNDTFLLDLGSTPTEAAEFDVGSPVPVEKFLEWLGGGAWASSWNDVSEEHALFGPSSLSVETFDEGWQGNEGAVFSWGSVLAEAALFDTTPEAVEDFDEEFTTLVMKTL